MTTKDPVMAFRNRIPQEAAPVLLRFSEAFRWLDRVERALGAWFQRARRSGAAEQNLADFYRKVWEDAAREIGATTEPLGLGVVEIALGANKVRVHENRTGIDDQISTTVVRSKAVMSRLFEKEGLRVPKWLDFRRQEIGRAFMFMRRLGGANCVVKPGRGTGGGMGVTTGVHNTWGLCRAVAYAGHWGDSILIEEQIPGDNYRLLFLDGKLLDAVHRRSPCVMADGRTRIGGLIHAVNAHRAGHSQTGRSSHAQITIDLDLRNTLQSQNLTLKSIPPLGTRIRLKTASNENSAEENFTVTNDLHPSVVRHAARAAAVSELRLAGVDLVMTDHSRSLQETGGVILEVNSPPGYFWHYNKADGAFPLAIPVLRELFKIAAKRTGAS